MTDLITPISHGGAALTGFGLCLSLIVAIGAQNAFLLRQGLAREHVGPLVLLCTVLDVALMATGVLGLATLLGDRPGWLEAMAWFGVAWLIGYGLLSLRRAWRPGALASTGAVAARPLAWVLAQALAISLLNPHVYLDTVVLVGSVGARQPEAERMSFLLGAGLASTLWFVTLGYGARWLAPWFRAPRNWRMLDAGIGVFMLSLAGSMAHGAVA